MNHDDGAEQKRPAEQAIELVRQDNLVYDELGVSYALIVQNGVRKVFPINSQAFKDVLQAMFEEAYGIYLKRGEISEALYQLDTRARIKGRQINLELRVAGDLTSVYIDLGNDDWTMVHVTKDGWSIVPHGDRLFRRPKGMLPLPEPVRGGKIEDIRRYINVRDEDFPLVIAWLVAALHPIGPYPILFLQAEHGTAKSSGGKMLRRIVDHNFVATEALPSEINDLQIRANQSWVLSFDNLSNITQAVSDELCRIATEGGSTRRTLFKDDELTMFNARRPIIITSITDVAKASDLLSRCLTARSKPISGTERKTEGELRANTHADAPRLFGALLDGIASALANYDDVLAQTKELPRMADGYVWALAAAPGLGLSPDSIEQAWKRTANSAYATTLEDSIIAEHLVAFLRRRHFEWVGTMKDLLNLLEQLAGPTVTKRREWPRNAEKLRADLARISPGMRAIHGIDHRQIEREAGTGRRLHQFRKMEPSQPSQLSECDRCDSHDGYSGMFKVPWKTNPGFKPHGHPQHVTAKYKGAKTSRPKLDPNHSFLKPSNAKIDMCYVCRKRWDQHGTPGRRDWEYIRAVSPPLG